MKHTIVLFILAACLTKPSHGQLKEAAQLASLTPTLLVVMSDDIIPAHKLHFTVSTVLYMGSYMVTESEWQAIVISLLIGAVKEVVYDGLMGRGDPWSRDMMWNTLGVAQGAVFTLTLRL